MLLAATDYVRPDSLADAVTALAENENARPWREARLRAAAQRLARRAAGPGGDFSMIVSGRAVVPVAVPELWAALSDPARLGQALPHVDTVDVRDDGSFGAISRPRTGLGDTPLRMEFEIADRREGEHVRIVGSGLAGENTVSLNIELDLASSNGGSSSEAKWSADVRVGGVLASLVQRALPALLTDQVNLVLAAARGGAA